MYLNLLYTSVRSALSSQYPYLTKSYYRERNALPVIDREILGIFKSSDIARQRFAMATRRHKPLNLLFNRHIYHLPKITLCMVTHNSSQWIESWMEAVASLDYPRDNIIFNIVDNGSTDDTVALLESAMGLHGYANQMQIHLNEKNLGFGYGQDLAIKKSSTEFILVINPDAFLESQSLSRAVNLAMDDDQDVCAWEFAQIPFEHPKYYDPVTLETSWNTHSCILIRREAYLSVGGYDTNFFMYGEDVELSYRLRSKGYRLRYLPWARVTHNISSKHGLRDNQPVRALAANLCIRRRYGRMKDRIIAYVILALGLFSSNKERRNYIKKVWKLYKELRPNFKPNRPKGIFFPFSGVNFEQRRAGVLTSIPKFSKTPLISVITRVHKITPTLQEAIASIKHQTYPAIEHIIVCDKGIKISQPGAKVVSINDHHRAKAGNVGAKAANGKFLLFLDYDDLLFADHIEGLVGTILANPDSICAYAYSWEAIAKHRQGGRLKYFGPQLGMESQFNAAVDLKSHNYFAIQSVLIRKKFFDDIEGFNEDLNYLEDWDLWRRLSLKGKFIAYPKTTSIYFTPGLEKDRIKRIWNFTLQSSKNFQ